MGSSNPLFGDNRIIKSANANPEEIKKSFPPGWFSAVIDGADITDKKALMGTMASAFKFPAYFGGNWDALLDCMKSLPDFIEAGGYALIVSHSSLLLSREEEKERGTFVEIIEEAGAFLEERYGAGLKIILL